MQGSGLRHPGDGGDARRGARSRLPARGRGGAQGKSQPVAIHALVGDAALAQSAAFKALAAAHDEAITALRAGTDATDAAARCAALAEAVEPGLASFYAALPARAADFGATALAPDTPVRRRRTAGARQPGE